MHTVIFARTVILSDKCSDGDSDRTAYHPEDRIQFSVSRPGGDSIRSEAV